MASRHEREGQDVYLTYRDTFCGSKARVRDRKVIRSIVLKHRAQSGIAPDEQHLGRTISILRVLLKDRVFEFENRARKAFPGLFAKSPPPLHAIAGLSSHDLTSKGSRYKDNVISPDPHATYGTPIVDESQLTRFPFEAQHHVLSRVQQLLEETCFRFMTRWLPSMLVCNNWTCAAAIELTKSLSIIKNNLNMLPDGCMDNPKQALFRKIAPEVAQLRHSAVHRLHLEHDKFLRQIDCASSLAGVLHHPENLELLQDLHKQVDALVKKLEYETNIVKQKADCILSQLSQQREVLMQREQQLRDFVAEKYVELAAAAGRGVFKPVEAIPLTDASDVMPKSDGAQKEFDSGAAVYENDIDSDEDRLQAELG